MTLNQFLVENPWKQRLTEIIYNKVINSSKLRKLGALYIHLKLNRLISSNNVNAIRDEFTNPFYPRKYFNVLKITNRRDFDTDFECLLHINNIESRIDMGNTGNIFSTICNQYKADMARNVKKHGYRHIRTKYFKNFLDADVNDIDDTMEYLCITNSNVRPNIELLNNFFRDLRPLLPENRQRRFTRNGEVQLNIRNQHIVPRGWLGGMGNNTLWQVAHSTLFFNH